MHLAQALAIAAFAATAHAHSTMFSVWVNDVDQGDGRSVYIRSPPNNNPVKDLTSADLVCNVNGATAVSKFVPVTAGDKLTFEWYHNSRGDDIIDSSHIGPIITYVAPYTDTNGASAIWTKIAEEGYDGSSWAVTKLIANEGKKDFVLPSSLAAGKYLIRQEIIALHEADSTYNTDSARGAQFYPSCVQIEVSGSGSAVPDQDFDFNTGYTYTDPGIHFNVYAAYTSYPIPGPAVWTATGTSPATAASTAAATSSAAATISASTSAAAPTLSTTASADAVATTTATLSIATSGAPADSVAPSSVAVSEPAAVVPTSALAGTVTKATPTTFATVRRPTKTGAHGNTQTTAKPALVQSSTADCSPPHTRTVTVYGRPGHH